MGRRPAIPAPPAQPFVLTPKQAEANRLLAGPQRNTMLVGGSRSGKTTLIVRAIMLRAYKAPFSRHVIFRQRGNAARASIALDTLPKVSRLCLPGVEVTEYRQDGLFRLPNGSEVWIAGLDDSVRVEKVLGQEFCTIYCNESSQIQFSSVLVARTRLAQVVKCSDMIAPDGTVVEGKILPQRFYCDLNPSTNMHWTYHQFIKLVDPISKQPLSNPEDYKHFFLNPMDNTNLSPEYIKELQNLPERARRRFLSGQYISAVDDALWTLEGLEACRTDFQSMPDLVRCVVAVDPSGHDGSVDSKSDAIGICVAGRGADGHCYVLEDATMSGSPEQWGRKVVELYRKYRADGIIGEANFGGDIIRAILHAVDPNVPYTPVVASRGKAVRAAPVAALYEPTAEGVIRVHHVGEAEQFAALEDEMLAFSQSGYTGSKSPNRADSLVWAISSLMLSGKKNTFSFA